MAGKTTKKTSKAKTVVSSPAKPLEHVLVPKVKVLAQDELKICLDKFCITIDKLPLISSADPAIAYLDLKPGSVVEFTRKSLVTGGESPYYRLVVGA